jgi:nitroreductase
LGATVERSASRFTSSLASCFLYMILAATSLGLGTQWVSAIAHHYVQTMTKDLLKLPKEFEIFEMLAIGYPDMEPKPRLVRAKHDMVHYDYHDKTKFRTDLQIKDFIAQLRR